MISTRTSILVIGQWRHAFKDNLLKKSTVKKFLREHHDSHSLITGFRPHSALRTVLKHLEVLEDQSLPISSRSICLNGQTLCPRVTHVFPTF